MWSAVIHYFSGTGNTARIVRLIQAGLEEAGYHVELHNIEEGKAVDQNGSIQLFAFPVYAMAAPAIMLRYLRHMPRVNGVKVGIIAVWGEIDTTGRMPGWEGQALEHAKRILCRRGYDVFFTDGLGYPESFVSMLPTPGPEERVKIAAAGEEKVAAMVKRLLTGKEDFRHCSLFHQIWSRLVYYLYTFFGRHIIGKLYVAESQCSGCGRCAQVCPVGTIRMVKGQPRWNASCEGCQRCINTCPAAAIQTSGIRLLSSVVVFFLPYRYWLEQVIPLPQWGFPTDFLVGIVIWLCGMTVAGSLLDQMFYLARNIPGLNKLLCVSHTRRFLRYLEPHYRPPLRRR